MSGRKQLPQVAPPTRRQRLVEWGKDLLILALTCSAVFLAAQTPLVTQLRGLVPEPAQTAAPVLRQSQEALTPYAVAVRSGLGLYGVSYDEALVSRSFDRLSPLLGEALATAGTSQVLSRRQWMSLLDQPGAWCAFQGAPPLSVLSVWLGGEPCALSGGAQALLLSWDGDQVWLCWREGSLYRRAATQVAYEDHLETTLAAFTPNGAAFAATLAGSDDAYAALEGDVLVSVSAPRPAEYTASSPDFVGDEHALEQLLSVLGFQSGASSAYLTAGDLAISENGSRLRVTASGGVTFHAGEETRYPLAPGEALTVHSAALCAWELLNRTAAPWKGEGSFVLTGAEESPDGWVLTFQARLSGVPVLTGEDGWCARFTVGQDGVSDFSLSLRTYTAAGGVTVLPGERLAAAALQSLPTAGGKLTLCYSDAGGTAVSAGWTVEEDA